MSLAASLALINPCPPKTVRNIYVTLSSFFRWAGEEFKIESPMKGIPAPKFDTAPVEPSSREDVEALLKVCAQSVEVKTSNRRKFSMTCHAGYRNQSIILILLDTGLRASELCALNVGDLDEKTGRLEVKHGVGAARRAGRAGRYILAGPLAAPYGATWPAGATKRTVMHRCCSGGKGAGSTGTHYGSWCPAWASAPT
jgi:integrase/recombinase XerD